MYWSEYLHDYVPNKHESSLFVMESLKRAFMTHTVYIRVEYNAIQTALKLIINIWACVRNTWERRPLGSAPEGPVDSAEMFAAETVVCLEVIRHILLLK